MDIFNKKKVKSLGLEVAGLHLRIQALENKEECITKTCFDEEIQEIQGFIGAMAEYLNLVFHERAVVDERYIPPRPKMRMVLRAVKKK